ncbi:hypothetical protein CKAH01_05616 [Colletotrichum kahawae]|uniref:Uncharacterized protein n=1 Tax=Colletotrichum kahawae TaxID=34407 RepID=A0AAD9YEG3_COLKA|nr:hypothetical protein CKAH01_05616 [Colletotrichum kahawae]
MPSDEARTPSTTTTLHAQNTPTTCISLT